MFRNKKVTDHDQEEKQPHGLVSQDPNGLNGGTTKGIYAPQETAHEAAARGHAATDQYARERHERVAAC